MTTSAWLHTTIIILQGGAINLTDRKKEIFEGVVHEIGIVNSPND
jgi:hypothetical protein